MADLSIIVTAYNIEDYIEQCLESVAAQTLSDIEVLVVDDGSTDSTPDRIAEFCSRDPRFISVLLPENSPGGVATAANAGLDRATGAVGRLRGRRRLRRTDHVRAAGQCCRRVGRRPGDVRLPGGCGRYRGASRPGRRAPVGRVDQALLRAGRPHPPVVPPVHLRALAQALPPQPAGGRSHPFPVSDGFYEDNPFHWFALISARSIAVVPEVLCYHRVGRAGQTMAVADERLFQIFQHHDTIHSWLAERRLLDVYQTALVGWVISQMEWIARRTPPSLRRKLFDTLVPIFSEYSQATVASALREGNKGVTAQRLSAAVAKREYGSFVRTLSSRPDSNNPVVSAAFHLRHSGVRHTAVLGGRYLRNMLRAAGSLGPSARSAASAANPAART